MQEARVLSRQWTHREFRDVMGRFATGVTVVSTELDGRIFGMTANGFMSASLEPPLVVVSVARRARMHEALSRSGCFGVSVLGADQEHVSQHFGGRADPSFEPQFEYDEGIPVLRDALARVVARVTQSHEVGDHTLYVGEVRSLVQSPERAPLVFHAGRYRDLVGRPCYPEAWSGFALDPHVP